MGLLQEALSFSSSISTSAVQVISKREDESFRFTGIDVERKDGIVKISMDDYANSLEHIDKFRNDANSDPLTLYEKKFSER